MSDAASPWRDFATDPPHGYEHIDGVIINDIGESIRIPGLTRWTRWNRPGKRQWGCYHMGRDAIVFYEEPGEHHSGLKWWMPVPDLPKAR